jgi:hypothetical protein
VLIFNSAAVLVLGSEARNAFDTHAFAWAAGFSLFASAYLLGVFLHIGQFRLADRVNLCLRAGGIYLFAALTTALTVTDLTYEADAVGRPYSGWAAAACNASLIGSLLLALSFLTVLIKPHYGYAVAMVGTCLSWPYFAVLASSLPWRDFVWLVTIHWDGRLQVAAVFALVAATAYSIFQLGTLPRLQGWLLRTR